jgi:hypothetical protein
MDGGEQAALPDVPQGGAADVEEAKDIQHLEQAIVWNGFEGRHVFLLDQARGGDCIEQMFLCQGERMVVLVRRLRESLKPVLEPGIWHN